MATILQQEILVDLQPILLQDAYKLCYVLVLLRYALPFIIHSGHYNTSTLETVFEMQ